MQETCFVLFCFFSSRICVRKRTDENISCRLSGFRVCHCHCCVLGYCYWCRFNPWPWKFLNTMDVAKQREELKKRRDTAIDEEWGTVRGIVWLKAFIPIVLRYIKCSEALGIEENPAYSKSRETHVSQHCEGSFLEDHPVRNELIRVTRVD